MSKLPANTGWLWLKQGFVLFRQQPGILSLVLLGNVLASLLLSQIPYIGQVVAVTLIPSFAMAVMMACHLMYQGQRVAPSVLATGFQQPALGELCKLGVVYLVLFMLHMLLIKLAVPEEVLARLTAAANAQSAPASVPEGLGTLYGIYILYAIFLFLLTYAAPLTYWKKMSVAKAVFYSVFGLVGAIRPMLVLLFSWLGLFLAAAMAATLLSFGNALLAKAIMGTVMVLFMLALQCAMYLSFRQIFGDPDAVEHSK